MVKLRLPRIALSAPRLFAAVVVVGLAAAGSGYALTQQPAAQPPRPPAAAARQGAVPPVQQPTAATKVPAAAPSAAPAPAPVPAAQVTHSSTPAPVVTPSGNASVSGLAPVDPTPAPSGNPPAPAGNSSSGGSSATPPNSSTSTPPPQQTTGYTSTNWSGYLAAGAQYTAVSGSWTVPAATGVAGKTSADTAWVGIGGVTTSDLIQAGTFDTVSASGHETVQAFYELLPRAAHIISTLTVAPGDVMSAAVTETSANNWHIAVNDITNGSSYSTNVSYASAFSSAEWIEEDPSQAIGDTTTLMPLDGFAPVSFTGGTTTGNGTVQSIAASSALPVSLVAAHGTSVLAAPTVLGSGGQSFTVSRTSQ